MDPFNEEQRRRKEAALVRVRTELAVARASARGVSGLLDNIAYISALSDMEQELVRSLEVSNE